MPEIARSQVSFINLTKDMQLKLFDKLNAKITAEISLVDVFESYLQCRQNKRNTANAIAFEIDYEKNLITLWREINEGTYRPNRSIAFIIDNPIKREVFAADFRDRVVHHLLIRKLNPLFEKQFIHDSYACRIGKGTHFGIQRVERFIRKCSYNYTKDCHVLKLDIQGFFMHIDRALLFSRLEDFISVKYIGEDKNKIIELVRINIFNDPTHHCIKRSRSDKWKGLPASKSLFHSPHDCGLPIGNLTSQIFANFYMDKFDHYLKHDLGIRYYGRYVDDFVIIHQDHRFLKDLIGEIKSYLCKELHLDIHPKKVYLQHYTRGVPFLGTIIKPGRIYIGNRTKSNFFQSIARHNEVAKDHRPTKVEQQNFLSSMNYYQGILKHYNTYNLRKKILWKNLSPYWWNLAYVSDGYAKLVLKTRRGSGK